MQTKTQEFLHSIAALGCRRRGLNSEGIQDVEFKHSMLIVYHLDAPYGGAIYMDGDANWTAEARTAEFQSGAQITAELIRSGDLKPKDFD